MITPGWVPPKTGHMRASTAASLVGAAMLSTLIFPFVGMALRGPGRGGDAAAAGPAPISA